MSKRICFLFMGAVRRMLHFLEFLHGDMVVVVVSGVSVGFGGGMVDGGLCVGLTGCDVVGTVDVVDGICVGATVCDVDDLSVVSNGEDEILDGDVIGKVDVVDGNGEDCGNEDGDGVVDDGSGDISFDGDNCGDNDTDSNDDDRMVTV